MKIKYYVLTLILLVPAISISSYYIGYSQAEKNAAISWFLPSSVSTELYAATHIRNGKISEALKLLEFQALWNAQLLKSNDKTASSSKEMNETSMYAARTLTQSQKYIASYPESVSQLKQP